MYPRQWLVVPITNHHLFSSGSWPGDSGSWHADRDKHWEQLLIDMSEFLTQDEFNGYSLFSAILVFVCLCLGLSPCICLLSLYYYFQSFGKTRHSLWLLEKKPFSLNFRVYGKGGRLVIGINDPKGALDEDAIAIKSKRTEFKTNFYDKNQFQIDMISLRYTRLCWMCQNMQFVQLFSIFCPHWKLFEWRFCIYAHWPSLTFDKRGWPSIINSRGCGLTKAIIFGGRGSKLDCENLFLWYK